MKKIIYFFLLGIVVPAASFSQDCNCYLPMDETYTVVPLTEGSSYKDKGVPPEYYNDNGSTLPIKLPFSFCFYGQKYDTLFINNNGNISFKKPIYEFAKHPYPLGADTLMIAPFYTDVETYGGSKFPPNGDRVYYKITPTYMIIKWHAVGFYDSPLSGVDNDNLFNSFQLIITNGTDPILPPGHNVSFCYFSMNWAVSDTSGGFGGFGRDPQFKEPPAVVGINKGNKTNFAQFGTFIIPGTDYHGPFGKLGGVSWLDDKSFTFNTCVTGNTIAPVILKNGSPCDTLSVCALDTLKIPASFLSPQKGQKSSITFSSPGLSGLSLFNDTTVYSIITDTIQLIPSVKDVGLHVVNITATDNSSPAQVTVLPVTVIVKPCATGVHELNAADDIRIYPNPGSGIFTVQIDNSGSPANSQARVYDLLGNQLYSTELNSSKTVMNISAQPKGIYFLKIYRKNMLLGVKKIILQ